jgi:hypothetical protein
VRGCLSLCVAAIVTAGARPDGFFVIVTDFVPACGRVTCLAGIACRRMSVRLARCSRSVMAGTATLRRAFEPAPDVARCAVSGGMGAEKWKAGLSMIESAGGALLGMCRNRGKRQKNEKGREQNRSDRSRSFHVDPPYDLTSLPIRPRPPRDAGGPLWFTSNSSGAIAKFPVVPANSCALSRLRKLMTKL